MRKETKFESAQEAAARLGVTARAVQKWASVGKIPGAEKVGRSWLIPTDAVPITEPKPQPVPEPCPSPEHLERNDPQRPLRMAMPLLNSPFPVGSCLEYINSLPDPDDRAIALGEYYFFGGQGERAAQSVEPYMNSTDLSLHFSANLIATFANLSRGHIHVARFAMRNLYEQVKHSLASDAPPQLQAMGVFTATAASVLLHLDVPAIPPLESQLKYLPDGLKLYGCYILAHKAYLEKDYSRCLTIADMGLALCPENYPIAMIYNHIAAVMALMNLGHVEDARRRMAIAWELAHPDGLIEVFGEHHGLLMGMVEVFFKSDWPQEFERIIAITYKFSESWRRIHNPDTGDSVADNLTTTEFTIAMLYNRGWRMKEIAAHMGITMNSLRSHIRSIFNKLNLDDKNGLDRYMLQ